MGDRTKRSMLVSLKVVMPVSVFSELMCPLFPILRSFHWNWLAGQNVLVSRLCRLRVYCNTYMSERSQLAKNVGHHQTKADGSKFRHSISWWRGDMLRDEKATKKVEIPVRRRREGTEQMALGKTGKGTWMSVRIYTLKVVAAYTEALVHVTDVRLSATIARQFSTDDEADAV